MVKKIIQKLMIILALIFVLIPIDTHALSGFDGAPFEYQRYPYFDFCPLQNLNNCTGWSWHRVSYTATNNSSGIWFWFKFKNSSPAYHFQRGTIAVITMTLDGGVYIDTNMLQQEGGWANNPVLIGYEQAADNSSTYQLYLYFANDITTDYNVQLNIHYETGYKAISFSNIVYYNTSGQLLEETNLTLLDIKEILNEIKDDSAGQQMQEDKQEQQEQGQASQDTQQDTESSVDGSTQNLLSVIGNFFGAFTNARPSNCNFNWGLNEYGFGTINMCQTQIPSEFRTIFNILTIIIIIPMIMWLISSIINAFKEFQQ